ncbi:hypothetical protein ACFYWY_31090 [Streptomyces sp. NPDC002870]
MFRGKGGPVTGVRARLSRRTPVLAQAAALAPVPALEPVPALA